MNNRKNILFIILGFLSIFFACNVDDHDEICNSENPLEDIAWLSEIRDMFDQDMGPQRQRIIQYKYYGEDVFLIESCYRCPDALSYIYDCQGNVVCEFGGIDGRNTCPDFDQNSAEEKILYDN